MADAVYKKALVKVWTLFLEELLTDDLLDQFFEIEFLTPIALRDLMETKLTTERTRSILQHVLRSGPEKYELFKQCLTRTHQEHLVWLLQDKERDIQREAEERDIQREGEERDIQREGEERDIQREAEERDIQREAEVPERGARDVSRGADRNCPVCLVERKNYALAPCGHMTCMNCSTKLVTCPVCRAQITGGLKVYP